MIRLIINSFLTTFSVTPLKGDTTEMYAPVLRSGKGSVFDARIKELMKEQGMSKFSFPRVPDISSFDITLGYFSPLLLAFGLSGRLQPHITSIPNKNWRVNRYLGYVQVQLLRRRPEPNKFWKYVHLIVQRSNCYAVGCLHLVDKNAYRTLSARHLRQLLHKVDVLRGRVTPKMAHKMTFFREYIPKGETFRPLGVPTKPWRIYGNMLLHPLVMFAQPQGNQHGFRPGMGTLTAWKYILRVVIKSPNIYEFDLKQCFPTINLVRLSHRLKEQYLMPEAWANYYIGLNYAPPQFHGLIRLNEAQSIRLIETLQRFLKVRLNNAVQSTDGIPQIEMLNPRAKKKVSVLTDGSIIARRKMLIHLPKLFVSPITYFNYFVQKGLPDYIMDAIRTGMFKPGFTVSPQVLEERTSIPEDLLWSFCLSLAHGVPTLLSNDVYAQINRSVESWDGMTHEWVKFIGTAQGSPLSPYLAALAIDEIQRNLPEGVKIILYADDGIVYGPNALEFVTSGKFKLLLASLGFTLAEHKSGWVKGLDVWAKELKFLGLTYNGIHDTLRSSTRKGASLYFNKHQLLESEYDIEAAEKYSTLGLYDKFRAAVRQSMNYRASGQASAAAIASNYADYWRRFAIISSHLGRERFLWEYYVLLTQFFYYSRHIINSAILSGVLSLRSRAAVQSHIERAFQPSGIPSEGSAMDFLPVVRTVGGIFYRLARLDYLKRLLVFINMYRTPEDWTSRPIVEYSHEDNFPWYKHRHLFIIENYNKYLSQYRNKYTWDNFVRSRFVGLIMARMYSGSYSVGGVRQNFSLTCRYNSLAAFLLHKYPGLTVFTGTSYAVQEELRFLKLMQTTYGRPGGKQSLKAYIRVRRVKALGPDPFLGVLAAKELAFQVPGPVAGDTGHQKSPSFSPSLSFIKGPQAHTPSLTRLSRFMCLFYLLSIMFVVFII